MKILQIFLFLIINLFFTNCKNNQLIDEKGRKVLSEEEYQDLANRSTSDTVTLINKKDTTYTVPTTNSKNKKLENITSSSKLTIKVAKETEISINVKGRNTCYNTTQIDSIIKKNINSYNFKNKEEIENSVMLLTGSIQCWDVKAPGLQIEIITEEKEKQELPIVKEEKKEKPTTSSKPKVSKNSSSKVSPQKNPTTKKTVTTICYVKVGPCDAKGLCVTCEQFAKNQGILNIQDFCKMNGYENINQKIKKGTYLGVPCTPK